MSQELPADSIRELIMNAGDVVNACKVISAKDDTKYNVDGVEDDADGIEDDADGVKNDVDGAKDDADGVKDELGNVKFGVKTELDAVERYRRLAAYMEVLQNQRLLNYSSHYFSNYNWKKVVKLPVNTILKVECLP